MTTPDVLSQIEAQYVEQAREERREHVYFCPGGYKILATCDCGWEASRDEPDQIAQWERHVERSVLAVLREYVPTISCETCEGTGADHSRANDCDPRCDGSHERDGRSLCPRGPERCEPCDGSGRVPSDEWRYRLVRQATPDETRGICYVAVPVPEPEGET